MPWNPDGTRKRSNLYKKSSGFKMNGYSYPGTSPVKDNPHTTTETHKSHEKVIDTISGTEKNPVWIKTKGDKSSTYTPDPNYTEKSGGKAMRWVNTEGGSFISELIKP